MFIVTDLVSLMDENGLMRSCAYPIIMCKLTLKT